MSELPQVSLDDCPPGLFLFRHRDYTTLGFKSEYVTETSSMGNPLLQCDAYVVDSGEYFWGGAKTGAERRALMVTPLNLEGNAEFLAPFAYLPTEDEE